MPLREQLKRIALPAIFRRLNPHWHQLAYLSKFLDLIRADCVLDVGANAGQFGHQLRALGYRGLILSFEPDPQVFRNLQRSSERDSRWKAFNVALGARRGELQLNIMKRSEFNSFRSPATKNVEIVADFNRVVRQETVEVAPLSELLPALAAEFRFSRVFLKMDTQGYDWEVFSGLGDAVGLILGLQSEISVVPIYDGVPSWKEMIDRYQDAGFVLSNLFSVSPGLDQLLEFDCYMVRGIQADADDK